MNSNLKRFIGYLIYVIAFGYLVIKADDFHGYLKQLFYTTFNTRYIWLFMSVFPILVGLLIALPQFAAILKQKGSWEIDWIKLLSVGLPSLCVAIAPIAYFADAPRNWGFIGFIVGFHPSMVTVAGILFGFVLLTSFGKQESESTVQS